LTDYVDYVLICDPYRNRLLSDGSKDDLHDAKNLCLLLKNGLLKEVFHTHNSLFELRMSGAKSTGCVKNIYVF